MAIWRLIFCSIPYEAFGISERYVRGGRSISLIICDNFNIIIFPNACCQDPQGVLSCGDEDCEEESVEENCDCSKKDNYYNQIYNNGYCCDDNKNVFKYCDQTWPLSIYLIMKSESGSCANLNWNGNSLFIEVEDNNIKVVVKR